MDKKPKKRKPAGRYTEPKPKEKKTPLLDIVARKFGSRRTRGGPNRYIENNPTDSKLHVKRKAIREDLLGERIYTVTARSARSGRVVRRRWRDSDTANAQYHRWLAKGKLHDVSMTAESLADKADHYLLPYGMLFEVFDRGLNEWSDDTKLTPEQWAFARVVSFLEGGRAMDLDEDLIDEAKGFKITKATTNKSLGKLARRRDKIGKTAKATLVDRKTAEASTVFASKAQASKHLEHVMSGKKKLSTAHAAKIIKTLELNPKGSTAKTLNRMARKHEAHKKLSKSLSQFVEKGMDAKQYDLSPKAQKILVPEPKKKKAPKPTTGEAAPATKKPIRDEYHRMAVAYVKANPTYPVWDHNTKTRHEVKHTPDDILKLAAEHRYKDSPEGKKETEQWRVKKAATHARWHKEWDSERKLKQMSAPVPQLSNMSNMSNMPTKKPGIMSRIKSFFSKKKTVMEDRRDMKNITKTVGRHVRRNKIHARPAKAPPSQATLEPNAHAAESLLNDNAKAFIAELFGKSSSGINPVAALRTQTQATIKQAKMKLIGAQVQSLANKKQKLQQQGSKKNG